MQITRWLESPAECLDKLPAPSSSANPNTTSASGNSEPPLPRLAALNSFLSHRAVLVGRTARASLADISVFALVHGDVVRHTDELKLKTFTAGPAG